MTLFANRNDKERLRIVEVMVLLGFLSTMFAIKFGWAWNFASCNSIANGIVGNLSFGIFQVVTPNSQIAITFALFALAILFNNNTLTQFATVIMTIFSTAAFVKFRNRFSLFATRTFFHKDYYTSLEGFVKCL